MTTPLTGKGVMCLPVTGALGHAAGTALASIQNPEGVPIIVTRTVLYGITNSTGAANITVGQGASVTAGHDSSTLFTAAAQAASAGTAVVGHDAADAKDALPVVDSSEYIVVCGSASTVGYTGRVHIEYIRA
jgi:hypothetical protein